MQSACEEKSRTLDFDKIQNHADIGFRFSDSESLDHEFGFWDSDFVYLILYNVVEY